MTVESHGYNAGGLQDAIDLERELEREFTHHAITTEENHMSVRAKFRLNQITENAGSTAKSYTFNAVSADGVPENERYHKYTPSGVLTIYVDNPPAMEQFNLGDCYYLDFTPAPK